MAYTSPSLPASEPDIRVASTAVRRVPTAGSLTTAAHLTAALADAQFGDDIVLEAGRTFTGNFILKVPTGRLDNGSDENYVTIRSSALSSLPAAGVRVGPSDVANMPTLTSATSSPAISGSNAAHHYRFVGIAFTTGAVAAGNCMLIIGTPYTTPANIPSHISVERCYFAPHYDFGCTSAYTTNASHAQVVDSYFTNCMKLGNSDAQAITFSNGTGPYLIENCDVQGIGENIFTGGTSYSNPNITPGFEWEMTNDVTIRNCYIWRPLSWKSDHATYLSPCNLAGTVTFTTSGVNLTLSGSQPAVSGVAFAAGKYIKNLTTGEVRKILSGSGTTWTLVSAFSADVMSPTSFRFNSTLLSPKNLFETKGGLRLLIDKCVFRNGWLSGQSVGIQFSAKEGGYLGDVTMQGCKFIDCGGIGTSPGDVQTYSDWWPTAYPTRRLRVSQCLFDNVLSTEVRSLLSTSRFVDMTGGPSAQQMTIPNALTSGTIQAGATTGTGVTFTAVTTRTAFQPWCVGAQLRYGTGRATIVSRTDASHVVADITADFPDTTAHTIADWDLGHASILGTSLIMDSFSFEHITAAGPDTIASMTSTIGEINATVYDATAKHTNMRWRYNILQSAPGIQTSNSSLGTAGMGMVWDTATRVWQKNVLIGAGTTSGLNYGSKFTGADDGGAGSTHNTACHDPNHIGVIGGGEVGFADFANRDYTLTSSSPYCGEANWTGDGLPAGCDVATYDPIWTAVIAGTYGSTETPTPDTGSRDYAVVRIG